jgi:heavy-metal-associated domain-containing protein
VERRSLAVAHAMPGRLRLRLPVPAQTSDLVDVVRVAAGVTDCAWNEHTRSLLVRYRPEETTTDAIIETVAAHAGIAAPDDNGHGDAGETPVAEVIAASVTRLNTGVVRATGGRLDLGVLVPLALGAWAFRQLLRSQVAPLSWSSALWYAHGLFRDYAARHRP